jgi:hypothetical protein
MVQLGFTSASTALVTTMIDQASTDLWIVSSGAKCFEDLSLLSTNTRDDLKMTDGVAEGEGGGIRFGTWR